MGGSGGRPWDVELRAGARANLLMGVTSARIGLKAACARAERLLARYAEPLQALHGAGWPAPFLDLAWSRLVECSGHDSVTGCGADAVADQVAVRLAEASELGEGLAERAAGEVAARVPRGVVAVLNPSPFRRAGLVELDLPVPDAWDEVALALPDGRLLETQEGGRTPALVHREELPAARLGEVFRRVHGRELFGRVVNGVRVEAADRRLTFAVDDRADPSHLDMDRLRREVDLAAAEAPDDRWELRVVAPSRRRLLASVPAPPLGWTTVRPRATGRDGGPDDGLAPVTVRDRELDNGLLAVAVAADGALRLRGGGVTLDGVGRLSDGGDAGDLYNYAPPANDLLRSTGVPAERIHFVGNTMIDTLVALEGRHAEAVDGTPDAERELEGHGLGPGRAFHHRAVAPAARPAGAVDAAQHVTAVIEAVGTVVARHAAAGRS